MKKLIVYYILLISTLLLLSASRGLDDTQIDTTTAATFAVLIAGVVGVPIVQGIKKLYALTGKTLEGVAALWVTIFVSIILAVIALYSTGAFSISITPETIGAAITSVFAVATIIYKSINGKTTTTSSES